MSTARDAFKKKILEEMTVDYTDTLQKNFDLAKQFVRVTNDGHVDLLVKEKVGGKDQILLYLIGKMYAKEAGLSPSDDVGNEELERELQIKTGSLLPWLKELRDTNKVKQVRREAHVYHSLPPNQIESTLKLLEKKVKKGS
ncbi:MAG: hypothetical protein OK452_09055 [Thaumarchaeota archaeon]|nr:hypothetical protein [Nitrososphaerota archaeon]